MSAAPKDNHTGRPSLISRLATSTALLAAAIVLVAFVSYHAIRGDVFNESFETPLDEWSEMMSKQIGSDPEIARAAARNHKMGVPWLYLQQARDPAGRPGWTGASSRVRPAGYRPVFRARTSCCSCWDCRGPIRGCAARRRVPRPGVAYRNKCGPASGVIRIPAGRSHQGIKGYRTGQRGRTL